MKFKRYTHNTQSYIEAINDFANSSCECIQQELTMSTKWMDTSSYTKSKALLKLKSQEINKFLLRSKRQVDFFE